MSAILAKPCVKVGVQAPDAKLQKADAKVGAQTLNAKSEESTKPAKDVKDVEECSICSEEVPVRFLVGSMCIPCSVAESERVKSKSKPTEQIGHFTDPVKRVSIHCCPWCSSPLGGWNLQMHYNKCASFPSQYIQAAESADNFKQWEWQQLNMWTFNFTNLVRFHTDDISIIPVI